MSERGAGLRVPSGLGRSGPSHGAVLLSKPGCSRPSLSAPSGPARPPPLDAFSPSVSVPPSRPGSLRSPERGPRSARSPRIYTRTGDEGKAEQAAGSTGRRTAASLRPGRFSKASPAPSLGRGGRRLTASLKLWGRRMS